MPRPPSTPPPAPPRVAIDYGSRSAGTTVLVRRAPHPDGPLVFTASVKKQDADALVADELSRLGPADVYLDAPLSLPGVYRGLPPDADGTPFEDHHYRRGDRQLAAMSPMFLGGLTARAMKLAAAFPGHRWHETYPAAQAKRLALPSDQYKKSADALPVLAARLVEHVAAPFDAAAVTTWHHFDALLAWLAAERCARGEHDTYGHPAEGLILV
ncbi:MAG: hypothetical protein AAGG38_06875 [Planctomycetota bacterium]